MAINGLLMLVAQAKEAAEWFSGTAFSDEKIPEIHSTLRRQMENIILIGMPGCGKSTIGKKLAETLNKEFIDADQALEAHFGRPITDIIPQDGEAAFRAMETEILQILGKKSGLIIATGGGCVTQEHNYPLLHQNGTIFWLKRDLQKLPIQGRPLSQKNKLSELYEVRKPLYQAFADITIDNDGNAEQTIQQILEALK